jgi:hypothetical protein
MGKRKPPTTRERLLEIRKTLPAKEQQLREAARLMADWICSVAPVAIELPHGYEVVNVAAPHGSLLRLTDMGYADEPDTPTVFINGRDECPYGAGEPPLSVIYAFVEAIEKDDLMALVVAKLDTEQEKIAHGIEVLAQAAAEMLP